MTVIDGNTLDGVSATTLWTLHNRADEARRPDGAIEDPWAVALYDKITYDYLKFGKANQSHGLRAAAFDGVAADYLLEHPQCSIIALAEGLQTSFWRLDASALIDEVTWYSVDLPPVMALREQLLPDDDRIVALAQQAHPQRLSAVRALPGASDAVRYHRRRGRRPRRDDFGSAPGA